MPPGPKGEKRPAAVNARAVMIAKIATGEVEDAPEDDGKDLAAKASARGVGAGGLWIQRPTVEPQSRPGASTLPNCPFRARHRHSWRRNCLPVASQDRSEVRHSLSKSHWAPRRSHGL
jgi:hypothetical protein